MFMDQSLTPAWFAYPLFLSHEKFIDIISISVPIIIVSSTQSTIEKTASVA